MTKIIKTTYAFFLVFLFSSIEAKADDLKEFILNQLESKTFLSDSYLDEYLYFDYFEGEYSVYSKEDIRSWYDDPELQDYSYEITYLDIISRAEIDDFVTVVLEYGMLFNTDDFFIVKSTGILLKTPNGYVSLFDAQTADLVNVKKQNKSKKR